MKNTHHPGTLENSRRTRRARCRITRRRRRTMTTSALRGACYSAGAGAVGLLFWWLEQGL